MARGLDALALHQPPPALGGDAALGVAQRLRGGAAVESCAAADLAVGALALRAPAGRPPALAAGRARVRAGARCRQLHAHEWSLGLVARAAQQPLAPVAHARY